MADVFVSYDHEDKDRIAFLIAELKAQGLVVWWDREVVPGAQFQSEIQRQINECEVVVVVWSRRSIRSDWVRAEAMLAFDRKNLISVRLDDVEVPLPFNIQDGVDLVDWPHQSSKREMSKLVRRLRQYTPEQATAEPEPKDENLSIRLARRVINAIDSRRLPGRNRSIRTRLRNRDYRLYLDASALLNQFTRESLYRAAEALDAMSRSAVELNAVVDLKVDVCRYAALLGDPTANDRYAAMLGAISNADDNGWLLSLAILRLPEVEGELSARLVSADDRAVDQYATLLLLPMAQTGLASSFYELAMGTNPLNVLTRFHLARAKALEGDLSAALDLLETCIFGAPGAWFFRIYHAWISFMLGNEEAVSIALRSIPEPLPPLAAFIAGAAGDEGPNTEDVLGRIEAMLNTLWMRDFTGQMEPQPGEHCNAEYTLARLRVGDWCQHLHLRANRFLSDWRVS